jgi:uncharacterized membrane-anchored protein
LQEALMRGRLVVALSFVLVSGLAVAGPPPGGAPPEPEETFHWKQGPQKIELGHDIELALPGTRVFLGMPEADRFLKKLGSFNNAGTLGIVLDPQGDWIVVIDYEEEGHVKDEEKIDPPELLKAIREGTEESNKERVQNGFPELHVGAWSEVPHYDQAVHHLVWALPATSTRGTSINYNTRVLGRRGVVSLNLVTSDTNFAADRPRAAELLAATTFKKGARYEDFDKKTDKVAEYGLMGLILGGAGLGAMKLVKVGLLAKFWKLIVVAFLAAKKLIIALVVLIGAGVKKIFGGKKAPPVTAAAPDQTNDKTGTGG